MKRGLQVLAALALLATGYFLGASQVLTGLAGPLQQANCQTFPETKQTVCGRFLQYWQQNGGLAQQGYPISGELQERSDLNGQVYTVQYFERAEFEMHPENQPPYDVLLSQLGTFEYKRKYGSPPPAPAAPTATLVPAPPAQVVKGEPVAANGLVFTVVRLDRLAKRTDVAWTVKNVSGGPVQFTFANADQQLLDESDHPLVLADPSFVTDVTIQDGDTYSGGTTWNGTLNDKADHATYIANNIPRIGSVRVLIPLK
jgi:hypothetical protein